VTSISARIGFDRNRRTVALSRPGRRSSDPSVSTALLTAVKPQ
jgi:hypothetical protein